MWQNMSLELWWMLLNMVNDMTNMNRGNIHVFLLMIKI